MPWRSVRNLRRDHNASDQQAAPMAQVGLVALVAQVALPRRMDTAPAKVGPDMADDGAMSNAEVADEPFDGELIFEPEVQECALDEVSVVRVGDRRVVLPIPAELARSSGFDVLTVDDHVLLAIGVHARSDIGVQARSDIGVQARSEQSPVAAVVPEASTARSDPPDAPAPAPTRFDEVTASVLASVVATGLVVSVADPPGRLLPEINLVLSPGEVMNLLASDDPETTAVLRVLAGFDAPKAGSLVVDGERRDALDPLERRRREALSTGALFDAPVLVTEQSVATNLELPLLASGLSPDAARALVAGRLAETGLEALSRHRIDALRDDQILVVAAVRSLMVSAPLVVVAVATIGFSDDTVGFVRSLLDNARLNGSAVVVVSDDPRLRFPDSTLAELAQGRLLPLVVS